MTLIEPVLNQYITEVARIVTNFLISSSWFDSPVRYESNQIELMRIFPTSLAASVIYWFNTGSITYRRVDPTRTDEKSSPRTSKGLRRSCVVGVLSQRSKFAGGVV